MFGYPCLPYLGVDFRMTAYFTEIEWEEVEANLGMLTDETLERFLKKIIQIREKRASTPQVKEEAFE